MVDASSLRKIPSVDKVLAADEIMAATEGLPHAAIVAAIRVVLKEIRDQMVQGECWVDRVPTMSELAPIIAVTARLSLQPIKKRVINGTGVIIHTNLGRAPLAPEATAAAGKAGGGYLSLEYDLIKGRRGGRTGAIESLLIAVTGAEGALVVNNNAAALLLVLATLARDREVIVSRGELIEIGGSFRLPEVMAAGGCILREVGTTNRTRLSDYDRAISDKTALLLKVHTSNYQVVGFTETVRLAELSALGHKRNVPVVEDLGSGNLIDLPGLGEPTVRDSVKDGCELITFSGDKLLGGPQCGLIVGKSDFIKELSRHPVYRAVRVDKMTLAALETTLRIYVYDDPKKKIPVLASICQSAETLRARAGKLRELLGRRKGVKLSVITTIAKVGGGALPGRELKSWGLSLKHDKKSPDELAECLRDPDTPVLARIEDGAVILDVIAVADEEIEVLAAGIKNALVTKKPRTHAGT